MSYSFEQALSQLRESTVLYGKQAPLKFLVDAQLPQRLSDLLNAKGCCSIHTLDLPDRNATTDKYIKEKAYGEDLILITKDDDFLRSFIVEKKPSKLILVKTGNINNKDLIEIFDKGFEVITTLIENHPLLEITKHEIIVHD